LHLAWSINGKCEEVQSRRQRRQGDRGDMISKAGWLCERSTSVAPGAAPSGVPVQGR
jgi:hypothetical protein